MKTKWLPISLILFTYYILCNSISIAGLFEHDEMLESAFHFAVEDFNNKNQDLDINLAALTDKETWNYGGAFSGMNTTCSFLPSGIAAVFGPPTLYHIDAVQSVCDIKDIPHILTRWNNRLTRGGTMINFYPHPDTLTQIYYDIVSALKWETFTVLYEDDESLLRINDFVELAMDSDIKITFQQLESQSGNYRPLFKKIIKSDQKFFVIDCKTKNLKEVLSQLQQVGMMTQDFNYFLTNLDAHTIEMMPFQFSETNITGIRLINPMDSDVQDVGSAYFEYALPPMLAAWKLQTESALVIDAVNMIGKVLAEFFTNNENDISPLDCENTESWKDGLSFLNILKTSSYKGLTGQVSFDREGYRSKISVEVYEVMEGGITTVGFWNSESFNISRPPQEEIAFDETSMRNKSFTVVVALTPPYGMLKESPAVLTGNERLEGFGIDLIHELSLLEGFNYTFVIIEDNLTGKKEADGRWSGMLGKVKYEKDHLGITDLTITSERSEAVDFTPPFMNLGISILFRKPTEAPPSFFSFADPFALETWVALGIAFLTVSFSFFILGRMCPSEWTNPFPCIEEPEFLVNQFSLGNSFWFTTGAIMQQGSEIAPISVATRLVSGVWWFFVLLIIASYTANLASFLVTENTVELFSDVNSLVENAEKYEIRYGAKENGATFNFFRDHQSNPVFKKIYKYMIEHPEDMVKDNSVGVERAEDPDQRYAFFMESTSIEYEIERRCDLTMVGGRLDNKGYGIAMQKNSLYQTRLSTALLKLQSSGEIDKLKRKWWKERRGGGQCDGEEDDTEATPLDLENVEGVFYVTIYGTLLAALLVCIEYLINVLRISKKEKLRFKAVFKEELRAYIDFNSDTKAVIRKSSEEKSLVSKDGANPDGDLIGWSI